MAIISFSATFNLAQTTKQFHFTDTSDYDGQGLGLNDMFGAFRIIAPSGNTIYNKGVPSTSNFDIRNATSRNSVGTIIIPISSGAPEQGLYKIIYTVWDDANSVYYTITETFNFIYASPVVSISGSVQVYTPSPLLTEYDNTIYIVNSVVPTLDRTATITYPPIVVNSIQSTPAPTIGHTATTTSNTFYSPTTVDMAVISNLTYVYTGTGTNTGFTVIDLVGGNIPFAIDATSFCKLYCGLKTFQARCVANPQDQELKNQFSYMMGIVTLIMLAQNCGKTDIISSLITQLEATGNFTEDCTCGSGVQQVIGLGAIVNAYNSVMGDDYIIIDPETSGNTTTWTFTLSPAFVNIVSDLVTRVSALETMYDGLLFLFNQIYLKDITITSADGSIVETLTAFSVGATFVSGGTGYLVDDILTAAGGTHATATQIQVNSVNGGGGIATFSVITAGNYSVIPTNFVTFTGGAGSGAQFNLYWNKSYDQSIPFLYQGMSTTITNNSTVTRKALFTGLTILQAGNYEAEFEGTVNTAFTVTDVNTFNYYFYKLADITTPIGVAPNTRTFSITGGAAGLKSFSIVFNQKLTGLAVNDVIGVAIIGTDVTDPTTVILNRSLKLKKSM